jgi:transcriptional regulator GlxA family with amidase domain
MIVASTHVHQPSIWIPSEMASVITRTSQVMNSPTAAANTRFGVVTTQVTSGWTGSDKRLKMARAMTKPLVSISKRSSSAAAISSAAAFAATASATRTSRRTSGSIKAHRDGGRAPEYIRNDPDFQWIARHFFENEKPVAQLCHASQALAAAGVLGGRRTAAYPALAPDVEAAGAEFVDAEAVVDGQMVSARAWPDHSAWMREFIRLLREKAPAEPLAEAVS